MTIAREDYLGVNHWSDPKDHYYYHDHFFNFPQPISFRGDFSKAEPRRRLPDLSSGADEGLLRSRRQDRIPPDRGKRYRAAGRPFDLLVVSTGKGPLGQLFTYRPEHTPYSQPQRRLCVGLYTGVRQPDPMNVTLSVSPGHGEMIVIPTITFDGVANALLMENVPGGDMEELATLSYEATRSTSCASSWTSSRSITPRPTTASTPRASTSRSRSICCRAAWCRRCATRWSSSTAANARIALGDVHSVVDPMMGQGANVASYAAFVLGEEIVNADVLDARFCEKVDLKRQDRVLAAARWTNLMLQPPSEALGMLIGAMSQNRALADEFTENFNYPDRQWDRVSSPQRIQAWHRAHVDAPAAPVRGRRLKAGATDAARQPCRLPPGRIALCDRRCGADRVSIPGASSAA